MKTTQKLSVFMVSVLLITVSSAAAQTFETYDIPQSVLASGGGQSESVQFKVEGTVGQNIAGALSGGMSGSGTRYTVLGGFWTFQQPIVIFDIHPLSRLYREPNKATAVPFRLSVLAGRPGPNRKTL